MLINRFKGGYRFLLLMNFCAICISFKGIEPTKNTMIAKGLVVVDSTMNYDSANIYKIGNIYHYSVNQKDVSRILDFKVIMEILPGNINGGQQKLKYIYRYDNDDLIDKDFRDGFPVENKKDFLEFSGDSIVTVVEGFIEVEEKIWFHPMRHFSLYDLEYAPFPKIRLQGGTSIFSISNLYIPDSYYPYGIVKRKYETPVIEYLTSDSSIYVARINSHSKFKKNRKDSMEHRKIKEGVACTSYFLFHSEKGFVEINHEFMNGNMINIVLDSITVKDHDTSF